MIFPSFFPFYAFFFHFNCFVVRVENECENAIHEKYGENYLKIEKRNENNNNNNVYIMKINITQYY